MPERLEEKVDARELFTRADSLLSSVNLITRHELDVVATCIQGYVLCGACAVELYMKILAQLERDAPPLFGHDFKALIHDLKSGSYRRLKAYWLKHNKDVIAAAKRNKGTGGWQYFPPTFEAAVKESAKAFIKFRYGERDDIKGWFLTPLAPELRRMVLEIAPDLARVLTRVPLNPDSNLAATEDDNAPFPRTGWAILNHKAAPLNIKVGRGSDPKDGGPR